MTNSTHFFYSGILSLTTVFDDNSFKLDLGSTRMVKMKAPSTNTGNVIVSFRGADESNVDAEILPGEELNLEHFQTSKLAFRAPNAGDEVRAWAY